MKKPLISLALIAFACSFIACADEEPEPVPGTLTVMWAHTGVATCASREIVDLRVWISHPDDETQSQSQTVACPPDATDGAVLFEDVMPATYTIGVDGIRADEQIYYQGSGKKKVSDGADAVSSEVLLEKRKSTLHVEWNVWGQCHKLATDPGLAAVSIKVFAPDEDNPDAEANGACDAEFANPHDSGALGYGLLFEELDPEEMIVVVEVLNDAGVDVGKIDSAEDDEGNPIDLNAGTGHLPIKLNPGQHHKVVVSLVPLD